MNYESMKVFRDGNQLVIVLENAGKELEGMVMSMIGGNIPKVEYLSPPAPIPKERPDIENMKEMSQAKPAKFIQENRRSGDMRTVRLEEEHTDRANMMAQRPDPYRMNYFELKTFLEAQSANRKLRETVAKKYHTGNLAFVFNTKGETELRALATAIL